MKTSSLALAALLALAPLAGAAEATAPRPAGRPSIEELKKNIERWKTLPPAERERIKSSFRQYKSFNPDHRTAVQENFRKFRDLPPERRRELTKKFEGLPPQQRERIAQWLRAQQREGADRRKMALTFARMAKSLTPEQRRHLQQLGTVEEKKQFLGGVFRGHVARMYAADLSPEERARFEQLPKPEQKQVLQRFFRERVMRGPPGERGGGK